MRLSIVAWAMGIGLAGAIGCGSDTKTPADGQSGEATGGQDWKEFPGDEGKTDSITPGDEMGYLTVVTPPLPQGVTVAEFPEGSSYRLKYRDQEIQRDTKYRLKKGKACLLLAGLGDCNVEIKPGQSLEYKLAAVVAEWEPEAHKVDVGPRAKANLASNVPGYTSSQAYVRYLDETGSPVAFLVVPGKHQFHVSPAILNVKKDWTLAAGAVEQTGMIDADRRSHVAIDPPVRENGKPKEFSSGLQFNEHWIVWSSVYDSNNSELVEPPLFPASIDADKPDGVYTSSNPYARYRINNLVHFQLDSRAVYRMYSLGTDAASGKYRYAVNNTAYEFNPQPGDFVIEGQHLDINDSEVPDEQGVMHKYPSTYQLWASNQGNRQVTPIGASGSGYFTMKPSILTSPSGLDLAPGKYRVQTDFDTPEGHFTKVYECEFITPSISGEARCKLVSG